MRYLLLSFGVLLPHLGCPSQFLLDATLEHMPPQEGLVSSIEKNDTDYTGVRTLIRLLTPQRHPDVRVRIKRIGDSSGNSCLVNLRETRQLTLPDGQYSIDSPTHDIYFGEMYHESVYVKDEQLLRVPCGWFAANENSRYLRMFCFPKGSLVDVTGRVVDSRGKGLNDVRIECSLLFDDDNLFWDGFAAKSGKDGKFLIRNIPPASIDRVVFCLLYGTPERGPSFGTGIFYANLKVETGELKSHKRICLVSERNLSEVIPLAARIRSYGPIGGPNGFQYVDEDRALRAFPISTNNVIYVGDVVLPAKESPKRKD